jgi:hypothetical protein
MDTLHPTFVFEKINDGLPNIEKCMKDWMKNTPPKNIKAENDPSTIFVILAKTIVGNPCISMNLCCSNGQYLCL